MLPTTRAVQAARPRAFGDGLAAGVDMGDGA